MEWMCVIRYIYDSVCVVSGDANFHMERTALTVGGFTQPSVAKALIELPASVEKGLAQRFLWIVPAPSFATFDKLKLVDDEFSDYLGKCMVYKYFYPCINGTDMAVCC